jgi:hypothetical protein
MKYKITKEKVLEAIVKEPLTYGRFFGISGGVDDGKCAVCAVGAVLRAVRPGVFGADVADQVTNGTCISLKDAYKSGNFLSILSAEYEYGANEFNSVLDYTSYYDMRRFHALMVAEGMCPDVLEIKT